VIIDSSAILSILLKEDDAFLFEQALATNWPRLLSVAGMLEISIVYGRRTNSKANNEINKFINDLSIVLLPVTIEQVLFAQEAWHRFGKGRHPAKLNFGDCFAYALSKATGQPLLFKGYDFLQTDVKKVLPTFHYEVNN